MITLKLNRMEQSIVLKALNNACCSEHQKTAQAAAMLYEKIESAQLEEKRKKTFRYVQTMDFNGKNIYPLHA